MTVKQMEKEKEMLSADVDAYCKSLEVVPRDDRTWVFGYISHVISKRRWADLSDAKREAIIEEAQEAKVANDQRYAFEHEIRDKMWSALDKE